MGDESQTIRRGRKFDQVLAGARDIFLRDGFEGASVDDIARAAGVSKATLYNYFPDKRLLFMEVARAECLRAADEAEAMIDDDADVAETLRLAGERIVAFAQSDFGQKMFRMCVAESDRFPALGAAFYDSGPKLIRERLTRYLAKAVAGGDLRIDDLDLAADRLLHGVEHRKPQRQRPTAHLLGERGTVLALADVGGLDLALELLQARCLIKFLKILLVSDTPVYMSTSRKYLWV